MQNDCVLYKEEQQKHITGNANKPAEFREWSLHKDSRYVLMAILIHNSSPQNRS